jgi:hypothetical protein
MEVLLKYLISLSVVYISIGVVGLFLNNEGTNAIINAISYVDCMANITYQHYNGSMINTIIQVPCLEKFLQHENSQHENSHILPITYPRIADHIVSIGFPVVEFVDVAYILYNGFFMLIMFSNIYNVHQSMCTNQ